MTSLDGRKPVFHGARAFGQNPGIANLVISVTLGKISYLSAETQLSAEAANGKVADVNWPLDQCDQIGRCFGLWATF